MESQKIVRFWAPIKMHFSFNLRCKMQPIRLNFSKEKKSSDFLLVQMIWFKNSYIRIKFKGPKTYCTFFKLWCISCHVLRIKFFVSISQKIYVYNIELHKESVLQSKCAGNNVLVYQTNAISDTIFLEGTKRCYLSIFTLLNLHVFVRDEHNWDKTLHLESRWMILVSINF